MLKSFVNRKVVLVGQIFVAIICSIASAQNLELTPGGVLWFHAPAGTNDFVNDISAERLRWTSNWLSSPVELAFLQTSGKPISTPIPGPNAGVFCVPSTVSNGIYPVTAFGAIGDGATFCDNAFDAAISAAGAAYQAGQGGATVLVPPGRYLLRRNISIPFGTTLKGSWNSPHSGCENSTDLHFNHSGTMLIADVPPASQSSTPFITLGIDASLQGVSIMYRDTRQPIITSGAPVAFPWTIDCGNSASVINVTLVNSWQGIKTTGPHVLSNIRMCALSKGIQVNGSAEISSIDNVQICLNFWVPYLNADATQRNVQIAALKNWTVTNLVGFEFNRTDMEYVTNSFVLYAMVGFRFNPFVSNGWPNVSLTQCGADICATALDIKSVHAAWGLPFTNCQIYGKVSITNDNGGPVRFNNCGFIPTIDGDIPAQARTTGDFISQSGNTILTFNTCRFYNYSGGNFIFINKGALLANGCDFASAPKSGCYHVNSYTPSQLSVNSSRAPGGLKISGINNGAGNISY